MRRSCPPQPSMFGNIASLLNNLDAVAKDTLEDSSAPRISATSIRSLRRQAEGSEGGADDDAEVDDVVSFECIHAMFSSILAIIKRRLFSLFPRLFTSCRTIRRESTRSGTTQRGVPPRSIKAQFEKITSRFSLMMSFLTGRRPRLRLPLWQRRSSRLPCF